MKSKSILILLFSVFTLTVGSDHLTAIELDYPLQFDHADNEYVYIVMTEGGGSGTTVAIGE